MGAETKLRLGMNLTTTLMIDGEPKLVAYTDLTFSNFMHEMAHGGVQYTVLKVETDFEARTRVIFCKTVTPKVE